MEQTNINLIRTFIEQMLQPAATVSAEGIILSANHQLATLFKTSLKKLIGVAIQNFIKLSHLNKFQSLLNNKGKKQKQIEVICSIPDGTELSACFTLILLPVDNQVPSYCFTVNDLTQQKRNENEFKLLHKITWEISKTEDIETALQTTLRHMCDATCFIYGDAWLPDDKEGLLKCTSAWYSKSKELTAFGRIRENTILNSKVGLAGFSWITQHPVWISDVTKAKDFPHHIAAKKAGLKTGMGIPIIERNRVIAVMCFFMPTKLKRNERLIQLISTIAAHISCLIGRKRAEARLRENHALLIKTTRINSMGEIASILAHKLNQPLATVTSYTAGCIRRLKANNTSLEEITSIMEKVMQQAMQAGKIIHHVKSFIQQEQIVREEIVSVNELIKNSIHLFSYEYQLNSVNAKLKIKSKLEKNLPSLLVDSIQIEQVIFSLLKNAWEALQQAGTENPIFIIQTARKENYIHIDVLDNGPGIPEDILLNLSFPYFLTTQPMSMKIDLSISYTIIEAHGGQLIAKNRPKGGTWFQLLLPISK